MILTSLIDGNRENRELTDGTYLIGRGENCMSRAAMAMITKPHADRLAPEGITRAWSTR